MRKMAGDNPAVLRRLGPIEHFSSTRHHLGIYRCVTVACRYQYPAGTPPLGDTISPSFYTALASIVKAQPMLRVGLIDQHTNAAHFSHIPEIDLRNHVSVITVPCETLEEYEAKVAEQQGWHHDQLWKDLEVRPPWRINILRPGGHILQEPRRHEDVFFAYHHALMDGTSGRRLHEMLLSALNQQSKEPQAAEPTYILSFPTPPSLPETQEDVVNFTLSLPFIARVLRDAFGPSWLKAKKPTLWHGKKIDFSLAHITRVKPVDIPPKALSSLLNGCRTHSSSLTALFHALVLASLATRLPPSEAPAFAASTPINIRPFTSPSANPSHKDSLRVMISSITHEFPPDIVSPFRQPGADINTLIWQNAHRIKSQLTHKLSTIPRDDMIAMLKYIGDWSSFWRKKDGKPRTESWEVSNIGVLKTADAEDESSMRITRLLFTNGAMVAGPSLGVNVGSVAGSTLTVGLSWQDGVVSDEVMENLARDLGAYVARYHETGKFSE